MLLGTPRSKEAFLGAYSSGEWEVKGVPNLSNRVVP